jgi:hypothetical protein
MADTKITALTALTAADPANDVIPIVDVSDTTMAASGTTKKISVNNILGASGTATLASATITGDLTVDTSTLKVDSTNDRVGFGTASPAQGVHLSKSSTSTALTSPPVGGASFRIQNTSSTNNNFGSVEFYNAAGLFGASVNCQYTNQATPTSDLVFVTRGTLGGLEHYRIAADGVATWSEVGGVAGTAMTLNSTGLGVGVTPTGTGGCLQLKSGITFPATQVASSDANTLDDYEEGDWTIGLTFGGASTGITTNANTGRYTKIGRQVTVTGYLALTSKGSSTGDALITGLPFSISGFGGLSLYLNAITFADFPMGYANSGTSTIPLRECTNAGVTSSLTNSDFANNSEIIFTMTYTVA